MSRECHNTQIAENKKGKRKVQGVPQSQTAALPRPQKEEETDESKQAQTEQTQPFPDTKRKRKQTKPNKRKSNKCTKSIKTSYLFPKVIAMLKGLKNTRTK